jgi:hypothetical protein
MKRKVLILVGMLALFGTIEATAITVLKPEPVKIMKVKK